jgi:hypothetical protein
VDLHCFEDVGLKGQGVNRNFFYSWVVICLLLWGVAELHAQGSRPVSTVERRVDTINRQVENYEKERMRNDAKVIRPESTVVYRQRLKDIEEDLNALQDTYNRMLVALHKSSDVGLEFAEVSAADVKKHALRLRTNLGLPKPTKDEKGTEGRDLPSLAVDRLKMLTVRLYAFVTNPIFENMGTLDIEQSRKASKDLEAVIEIAQDLTGGR